MSFNLAEPLNSKVGASLLEYVLLISLIAVACIGAMTYFGEKTKSL